MSKNFIDLCSDSEEEESDSSEPIANKKVAVCVGTCATEASAMDKDEEDRPDVESSESEGEVEVAEKTARPEHSMENAALTKKRERQESSIPPPQFDIPEYQQIKNTCWACDVALQMPRGEFCLYSTHAHPLLDTPCCCICADAIALNAQGEEKDEDTCTLCARDHFDLVLCDTCDLQCCVRCLSKANGGGILGWERTQQCVQSNDPWRCPCCDPPASLVVLVESVKDEKAQQEPNRNDLVVLEELQTLEHNLEITDADLEKKDEQRAQIEKEFGERGLSPTDLQQVVDEELENWESQLKEHHVRLSDHIALLQDCLETTYGIDLSLLYRDCIQRTASNKEDENASWVLAAEREIRDRESKRRPIPPLPHHLDRDHYSDVEEIDDLDDEKGLTPKPPPEEGRETGFESKTGMDLTVEKLVEALRFEDEAHPEIRGRARKTTEAGDRVMTERDISVAIKTRVRSDIKMMVQSRRKLGREQGGGSSNRGETRKQDDSKPKADSHNVSRGPVVKPIQQKSGTVAQQQKKRIAPTSIQGDAAAAPEKGCAKRIPFKGDFLPKELKAVLKDHQIEGIHTMWRNCFDSDEKGGCILAHNMGLGKTLATLSFLSICMGRDLIQSVLICIPTNTISSWKNEFKRWISTLKENCICLDDLDEAKYKKEAVNRFMSNRGPRVLLVTHQSLHKIVDSLVDVDMVVIDEAHIPLKNPQTKMFKALAKLKTRLRIALTGTPLSNNLMEYHSMMSYLRPGILGGLNEFEREYVAPIVRSLPKDCPANVKRLGEEKLTMLYRTLKPYVNRKDASYLLRDLPTLQQVALHICPSKIQAKIHRNYKRAKEENPEMSNFFWMFKALSPVNNHPANLLHEFEEKENEDDDTKKVKWWWKKLREKFGDEVLSDWSAGYKIVLLLHIILMAEKLNEKVLVFSGCLKTLNFVQTVLETEDWQSRVPGLPIETGARVGGWKNGEEYLRIDGSMNSNERSQNIDAFQSSDKVRVFLLSVKATGVGITLTSASRVVIMDTDFNPTVSAQAIFRCYRYGQEKEVFVYRLLVRGTAEEKIHARCVSKTGLAGRVIDKKTLKRDFTEREMKDLSETLDWVQCDLCDKWRVLYDKEGDSGGDLDGEWYCAMNSDPKNNTCEAVERNELWYEQELRGEHEGEMNEAMVVDSVPAEESAALVQKDIILQHLLKTQNANGTKIVQKYKFQESLLAAKDLVPSVSTTCTVKVAAQHNSQSPTQDSRRKADGRKPLPGVASSQARKTMESVPEQEKAPSVVNSFLKSFGLSKVLKSEKKTPANNGGTAPQQAKASSAPAVNSRKKSSGLLKGAKPEKTCTAKNGGKSVVGSDSDSIGQPAVTTRSGRQVQATNFYAKSEHSTPEESRKRPGGWFQNSKKPKVQRKSSSHSLHVSSSPSNSSALQQSSRVLPSNQSKLTEPVSKRSRPTAPQSAKSGSGQGGGNTVDDAILLDSDDSDDETVDPSATSSSKGSKGHVHEKLAPGAFII